MPKNRKKVTRSSKNRRNTNKQHPKHFAKVYWPYIPIIAVVVFGTVFGSVVPRGQVHTPATLAYATEMSAGALLSATNQKRAESGLPALALNSLLNSSASAKANDMVTKDYWSHVSPSGAEPWVFFDASGYSYQKAGENLAYGFTTSSETIVGWMNSPSHRANMLDSGYTEVGFGFKNSENFVGTGNETVVVAHYAKPYVAPAPPPPPEPAPAVNEPAQQQVTQETETQEPAPSEQPVVETPVDQEVVDQTNETDAILPLPVVDDRYNQPVTTESAVPDDKPSTNITRLQTATDGRAPWSAVALSVVVLGVVGLWLLKHALLVKRFVLRGEAFVAHHPVIDLSVVAVVALAVYLSQSSGVVL